MAMSFKGKYNIGRKKRICIEKNQKMCFKCVLKEFLYYSKDKIQYL